MHSLIGHWTIAETFMQSKCPHAKHGRSGFISVNFHPIFFSSQVFLFQLHLEGANETSEEKEEKSGQDDFFASEEQFTSSTLEEPATALVKPKSPRDPVKNGDDGPAPDVSMAVSGEVS